MTQNPNSDSRIFRAAAKLTTDQRPAYLDEACGDNRTLRDEVESLLRAHDGNGSFLESPAIAITINQPTSERPGSMIGPYKLREQIGEGGFGIVYVAEQERPVRRTVALKVIKPGMDTKDVTARFEAERQALALMDHPNVARVLDAGTTDSGKPYFVMELVQGVTITDFCNRNSLPTRERLAVFADVCRAIQHAHQKGIIHRDLKPSNVMVTLHDGKPVPKVIDFGVSKALSQQLTEKSIYTAYGQMIGTPTYMSPEQAEMSGLGIDTRSDIYSLGVLLYELLTGQTPLDAKRLRSNAYAEILRLIREEEPPRPSLKISTLGDQATVIAQQRHTDPSQLRRDLTGELDWIVMKCLEKDRSRRYETATGLARDIERYLSDEPVEACPPSNLYRFKKFTRKHRVMIGTMSAFTALLITASLVCGWLAFRENRANRTAQLERTKAEGSLIEEQEQRKLASQRELEAQTARAELRETLYATNMNLVQSAWDNRQFGQVKLLLDLQRPATGDTDDRGWEWHFWRRRLEQGQVQIGKPSSPVDNARVSMDTQLTGDGSRLFWLEYSKPPETPAFQYQATGCGEVVVNDCRSRRELLRFQPFPDATGPLQSEILHGNHDGAQIAVYNECEKSRLAIFDGNSGAKIRDIEVLARPTSMHFNLSGDRIALSFVVSDAGPASDAHGMQVIQVWDISGGELIYRNEESVNEGKLTAAISPDGTRLLRGFTFADSLFHTQRYELVELPSGKTLWNREYGDSRLTFKCWSQDGRMIAIAEATPHQPQEALQLWDASNGETFAAFLRPAGSGLRFLWGGDVTISPDSKHLAQMGNFEIQLFDIPPMGSTTGDTLVHVAAPRDIIPQTKMNLSEIVFSADGEELLARTTQDDRRTTESIMAWKLSQIAAPRSVSVISSAWRGSSARFSPDSTRLAFLDKSGDRIQVWDTVGEKVLCQFGLESVPLNERNANMLVFAFSQDGKRLLTCLNRGFLESQRNSPLTRFWVHDSITGKLIWESSIDGDARSVDLHPRGDRVVTVEENVGEDGSAIAEIQLWDIGTGKLLSSSAVLAKPGEIKFVRSGNEIVLGALEPVDPSSPLMTGELINKAGILSTYRFVDSQSLKLLRTQSIVDVITRIDSRRESIFAYGDGEVTFYDVVTGAKEIQMRGILEPPMTARTPDGKRVAFAVAGRTQQHDLSIWSLKSGHRLLTLPISGRPFHVAFSADGNRLLVAHSDNDGGLAISTWNANTMEE